jgi:hypothetical protein
MKIFSDSTSDVRKILTLMENGFRPRKIAAEKM